ncbi:hypothetical protein F5887DRAFT_1042625 [Amanita rubescens]|nr:hypothetical protein F5887DRAFT_1042625 [Amanita rubescens]
MANQRLSTIYDYATLRLHRDGTRVQQSDENYHVPKRKQFAIRDANGNWIAKDAGGLGMPNKTRYVRREEDDEQEYVSLGGGEEEQKVEKTDEWVLLERERTQKKDHRTEKRRRFDENLDFLDISHNASSTSTPTREPSLPAPSSELLKSIHYFTASFYTDQNELLDLGKTYRDRKKARERLRYAAKKGKRNHVQQSEEDEESHSSEQESSEASTSMTKTSYGLAKTRRNVRKKHQQDMYKVMDGTALMALGMLVQEHVARLVQGKVPDGWEEEMRGVDELGEREVDGSEVDKSSSEEIDEAPSEVAEDKPSRAADASESGDDEIEGRNSDDEG